jgi:hypothetical protein
MGGAIFNLFGQVAITNSTVSGNTAQGGNATGSGNNVSGGSAFGGGIFNLDGTMTLTETTVAQNVDTAGQGTNGGSPGQADGNGLYNLSFGSFGGNSTTTLTLNNSIIGENTGTVAGTPSGTDLINNANASGNTAAINGNTNLVESFNSHLGSGTTTLAPNVITIIADPLLNRLAPNGSQFPGVETMAPQAGSPVLAAGNGAIAGLPTMDERGFPRPSLSPDLGAFQTQNTTTTVATVNVTYNSINSQSVKVSATVTDNGRPLPNATGTVTFTVPGLGTLSNGVNSSGVASVTYTMPAAFAAGTYTITATYVDNSGTFSTSTGTGNLNVNAAPTTTTVTNVVTPFSTSQQTITLTATVSTGANNTVNEGSGQFTVGTLPSVTANVSNQGVATATLTLPAGFAAGSYPIGASYTDVTNANGTVNFQSSSSSDFLTVSSAPTTATVAPVSTTFNTATQTVTLMATVISPAGTVDEGNMAFTVGNLTANGAVANGVATASLRLPAGFAAGSYPIDATFTDVTNPNNTVNFQSSSGSDTLTIASAATTTTVSAVSTTFNTATQTVTLSATVTSPAGTVDEGNVTFTVGTLTTAGAVANGAATATLTLPTGFAAGSYPIDAAYTDVTNPNNTVNFQASSGSDTLTVSSAPTTTTVAPASTTFNKSGAPQVVTLSTTVTSPDGTVNEGNVTFTVSNLTATAAVNNGVATATLGLPSGFAAGSYPIDASYTDVTNSNNTVNFQPSSGSGTLTVAAAPTSVSVSPVTVTFNTDLSQTVTVTATVTSPTGSTVNEGNVTFSISGLGSMTSAVGATGVASATFSVPADFNAGTYSIKTAYADTTNANATVNFQPSAVVGTLTVSPAASGIGVGDVSAVFNTATQTVTFSATVTSPTGGVVDEGNVTFTVANLSATASVANGVATTTVQLPPGFSATSRPVTASYADVLNPNGVVNFAASTGTGTLFINPAATQVALTTITLVPDPGKMRETATAQVISPAGPVTEGFVTFTIAGLTVVAPVVNGIATGAVIVGPFAAGNPQKAQAVYSDSVGNFTTSNTGGHFICLTGFDGVFPSKVQYTADGGQVVTTYIFGIPLVFTYANTGRITSVFFGLLPLFLGL